MAIQRPELINGEIYHIILRGVGDSLIFNNIDDYYRGIYSIYEFNDNRKVDIRERREARKKIKETLKNNEGKTFVTDERGKFVDILAFCFMPNHIHLLLKQVRGNGITEFIRKIGTGYAGYFNKKYSRKGHLFQGRFQLVHIKNEEQLKTVFTYIHTNPASLIEPGWKEKGIINPEETIKFLEEYKWSSYPDYIGRKNFISVTIRDFMLKIMGGEQGCKDFIKNWIMYKEGI